MFFLFIKNVVKVLWWNLIKCKSFWVRVYGEFINMLFFFLKLVYNVVKGIIKLISEIGCWYYLLWIRGEFFN